MDELSQEEIKIVLAALRSWLRKAAIEAFHTLQNNPSQGHHIIDDRTAPVERIIEKLQV